MGQAAQTRANRRVGGRKAALAAKARRARAQAEAERRFGPNGSERGTAPAAGATSIRAILDRIAAR